MVTSLLEPIQKLVHPFETRVRIQQAVVLQCLRDLMNQLVAATCNIRQRSQHPNRRRTESQDAEQLNPVARRPLEQEILSQLVWVWVDALDLSYLLDQKSKGDFNHGPIERRLPNAGR